ncbi:hypothetical protein JST97_19025 [bacterium]|nr:hypothetical protein [bacterium]
MDRRTALKIAGATALAVAAGTEEVFASSLLDGSWASDDGYHLEIAGNSITASNPDGDSKTMAASQDGAEVLRITGSPVSFRYAKGPPETLTRSNGKVFLRR